MPLIRSTETRRTETPNAAMTTLASPTQGGSGLSVWRVDMAAGAAGPPHSMSTEQVWTVVEGRATVTVGDDPVGLETVRLETVCLAQGDTLVLAAGVPRRITSDPEQGLVAIVAAPAGGLATASPDILDHAAQACATRNGDAVSPAWLL